MTYRFLALLGILSSSFLPLSEVRAAPAERVYVGVYLHDVTRFDQRSGTYEVDLDVWAKWLGDFDPNAIRLQNEAGDVSREDLGETSDGEWHSHRWRVKGTLRAEFPLQRFPFDVQTLSVTFELPRSSGELAPDLAGSGMAERFSVTGWHYDAHFVPNVASLVYTTDLGSLANEGKSTRARRVRFDVQLHRPTVTIAVKLFLPLFLLMLIAMMALFLGPELVDPRAGIGVTVLLACFAFQFTISGTIPDVAYLTVVDSLFIVAYAMTTGALIVSIVVYWIHKNGRDGYAIRVDRLARIVIPLAAFVVTGFILREPPKPPPRAAAPYPRVTRPQSMRDVVRIGTLQLNSPTGGALRSATRGGLVETLRNGERIGFLAEEAPSVSNDMMRFLAGGGFQITWRLRDGLKWSDGHALTSDDFRFALEVSPDPHMIDLETPDARTLILTYDAVIAEALEGFVPLPRHLLRDEAKRDAGFEAVRDAQRSRILATTGAYKITAFEPGKSVVAERNSHYIGRPASIGRVEVRCFDDADALAAAFDAHQIDIIAPNSLSLEQHRALHDASPDALLERASEDLVALSPDLAVPLFASRDVRRAILMAIDRRTIERETGGRSGTIANTPILGLAVTEHEETPFDPARARTMLEAENAIGQTIVLSHSPRKVDERIATAIKAQLEAVGFVIEIRKLPPGNQQDRSRAHGGLLLTTIRSDEDADPRRYWNLTRTAGRFVDADRSVVYDDAQADLVSRFTHALYVERRRQLRERNALAVARSLPILPLFFATDRIVATPALDGWEGGSRFGETLPSWHFTR